MSFGTIQRIVSDHLNLRKMTARYISQDPTDVQRAERDGICKENLLKFQQGTWRLCDVITGDESWFRHKQFVRKISNKVWVGEGHPPPNSPDLSPCDFWLFDLMKENLTDQSGAESLHDAVIDFMNSVTQDEYKKIFDKWIERVQL